MRVVIVKRHPEESARGGLFAERDHLHKLAAPKEWPDGDVFIADDEKHTLAYTTGVDQAISTRRLVKVSEKDLETKAKAASESPKEPEAGEIQVTAAALKLADEAGVNLEEVVPTGAAGQVTKSDVDRAIMAAKAAE